ncbi:MAG: zinc-binding dehydrogenase, partial [Ramlibacter sp.]
IALDLDPAKLAMALELGAEQALDAGNADDIKALRKQGGVHVAVVTSAAKAAYDTAFKCLRPGGTLSVVGLPAEPLAFSALAMVGIEARIVASSVGTRDDMREVLALAAHGKLRCITETQPLAEVNTVFERMRRGQINGRVVLTCCGGAHDGSTT